METWKRKEKFFIVIEAGKYLDHSTDPAQEGGVSPMVVGAVFMKAETIGRKIDLGKNAEILSPTIEEVEAGVNLINMKAGVEEVSTKEKKENPRVDMIAEGIRVKHLPQIMIQMYTIHIFQWQNVARIWTNTKMFLIAKIFKRFYIMMVKI